MTPGRTRQPTWDLLVVGVSGEGAGVTDGCTALSSAPHFSRLLCFQAPVVSNRSFPTHFLIVDTGSDG